MSEVYDLFRNGELYLAAGNARAAVAVLDQALQLAPNDRGLLRLHARALFSFASLGRAEHTLRALLELEPNDAEAAALLAATLRRRARPAEALPWQRLAELLDPDLALAKRHVEVAA